MNSRIHIILNPEAGAGKAKAEAPKLRAWLQRNRQGNFTWQETGRGGDAISIARKIAETGGGLILVAGGDGTINEVVNGLLTAAPTTELRCELGIINCGSGAGLAQTLGLPKGTEAQLDLIFSRPAKPLDVGLLTCTDEAGISQTRYFINECQIGISGAIVSKVGRGHKRLGGSLAFGLEAVRQLIQYKATDMRVRSDQQAPVSARMLGVVVGNGFACAGGMQLTPGARPDDGLLDALLIRDMTLPDRLYTFSKVYSGRHIYSRYYSLQPVKTMEIESEEPVWVETDGELIGRTPCAIRVLPGALRIRY